MGPTVAVDLEALVQLAATQLASGPFIPGVSGSRPPELAAGPLSAFASPSAFVVDAECHPSLRLASALLEQGGPWEAHEVLEALWHRWGRTTDHARAVQACIKLCAAEVKTRQRRIDGRHSHAAGVQRLAAPLLDRLPAPGVIAHIDVAALDAFAGSLLEDETVNVERLPLVVTSAPTA